VNTFVRPYHIRRAKNLFYRVLGYWELVFEDGILATTDHDSCKVMCGIANGAYNLGRASVESELDWKNRGG